VIYSLDERHNDEELVALIEAARSHISFAIYTFTLDSVADALIAAKARGVEVRGLVDSGQATKSFEKPFIERLVAAGIPILTEQHGSKGGIMHIKLLVTDRAYALGSYNWTASATKRNDEILEIGTDPTLRQTYENILRKLFTTYAPE
jgi:phosphatidylserine/phosphatidylglycerophosphate/cardiolipin synthase-like enzyme